MQSQRDALLVVIDLAALLQGHLPLTPYTNTRLAFDPFLPAPDSCACRSVIPAVHYQYKHEYSP